MVCVQYGHRLVWVLGALPLFMQLHSLHNFPGLAADLGCKLCEAKTSRLYRLFLLNPCSLPPLTCSLRPSHKPAGVLNPQASHLSLEAFDVLLSSIGCQKCFWCFHLTTLCSSNWKIFLFARARLQCGGSSSNVSAVPVDATLIYIVNPLILLLKCGPSSGPSFW